ncbi:hypothetical protein HanIR_Chr03g0115471 [Helianthus annuus]|nr:hypothetical protein HanIR_Chr03g0115471 [Helianthus annuus]
MLTKTSPASTIKPSLKLNFNPRRETLAPLPQPPTLSSYASHRSSLGFRFDHPVLIRG